MSVLLYIRNSPTLTAADLLGSQPEWQEQALCAQVDGELFYPEKGGTVTPAKGVCRNCEVKAECLDYALATDQRFGVWGGLSERERRAEAKRRAGRTEVAA